MLTINDQLLLEKKGISEEKIEMQLSHFKSGFPFMPIARPASPGDGILQLTDKEKDEAFRIYEDNLAQGLQVTKFVPASGAATRMFKSLYEALDLLIDGNHSAINKDAVQFFKDFPKFAFAKQLSELCGIDANKPVDAEKDGAKVLQSLLLPKGLNYGNKPKGVLKFHISNNICTTPVEEHMLEGALYCTEKDKTVHLHFTVSPEHEQLFKDIVTQQKAEFEKRLGATYKITFSHQKASTDTVAVTPHNELFRLDDGSMVFRPAGHGALIENLNDLHTDVVFIKNIDNVVPEHLVNDTVKYKKALAGTLLKIRQNIFALLHQIPHIESDAHLNQFIANLEKEYFLTIPQSIKILTGSSLKDAVFNFLNRPIRVCGMVRNVGEAGGGPFWVQGNDGSFTMQIVESSQINLKDPKFQAIMAASTHFNPVDLVCGIRNYKNQKFDLSLYVDPDTGFISEKSMNGKPLKALELPGLWNGAMAHWLTIFVEVPLSTFNPVKTVNDLLRPQHQQA